MEVLGRDSMREGYRVATGQGAGRVVGLIPDHVISREMTLTGGRGHQTAYDWIARHEKPIEAALRVLGTGRGRIAPPLDKMELLEDHG